jgi:hypothetical protein
MGGAAAGPRNKDLDGNGTVAEDNGIMDEWLGLTKSGGGGIANDELTSARARRL